MIGRMSEPLISVLMPVHNGGEWLAAAVASVLAQDGVALELVVVDDRSHDGVIDRLPASDPRLRIIPVAGAGLVDALNTGLAVVRGHWLARMDADDECLPGRLASQLAYLKQNPEVAIAGCRVEPLGAPIGAGWLRYLAWSNALTKPADIARELFVESPLVHPSWMLPTALARELGGWRQGDFPEDYDFLLRAAQRGLRFGKPEQPLLRWRDHQARLTRSDPRYSRAAFLALKARHLAAWRLGGRPVWIAGAGPTGRDLCDALQAEGVTVIGFFDVHPRRIGGRKRGLPVWAQAEMERVPPESCGLLAVGSPGSRERIRAEFRVLPWIEGENCWFVA
jgi:hypothetical protein